LLGGDGGGVDDEGGGGVFGIGDGVGQVALASITDPSGHVLVVGGVGGGDINDCVHDGSFGFVLQSAVGGVVVVGIGRPVASDGDDRVGFAILQLSMPCGDIHEEG